MQINIINKKRIFEFFLERYKLKSEKCLFIDNSAVNTETAKV